MATTARLYGIGYRKLTEQSIDWVNDTIKTALVTSAYMPGQFTDDFWDDVVANEASGTGYTAGGVTLGSRTITLDTSTRQVRRNAANASWAASTITARFAIVYKSTGVNATSPLIAYFNFGVDIMSVASTFEVVWSGGIVALTTVS